MEKINKYHNSKIYGLYTIDTNQIVYIGSTYNQLSKRIYQHKQLEKKHPERKMYKFISENGGFENIKIVLIENIKVENRDELRKIEQKYIDKYKSEI
jgi:hypothetical protein